MTSDTTHYVSYWENAPGQTMPAYVALALVSMHRALGERFLLLTPRTVSEHIDADIMNKAWAFEPLSFTLANGIEAIVAKSDYHSHGVCASLGRGMVGCGYVAV